VDDDFESLEPLESVDEAEISAETEEFPKEEDFNLPDVEAGEPDHPTTDIQLEDSPEDLSTGEEETKFSKPPILSPTLGEIYIAQGRFDEAIGVFKQLLAKDPENSRYQRKIEDLKSIIAKKKLGS
jgi:hypothetical protein